VAAAAEEEAICADEEVLRWTGEEVPAQDDATKLAEFAEGAGLTVANLLSTFR